MGYGIVSQIIHPSFVLSGCAIIGFSYLRLSRSSLILWRNKTRRNRQSITLYGANLSPFFIVFEFFLFLTFLSSSYLLFFISVDVVSSHVLRVASDHCSTQKKPRAGWYVTNIYRSANQWGKHKLHFVYSKHLFKALYSKVRS